ncbi:MULTISPECIES: BON domain-containing protein [Candidatus Ichthyocystis]|uniref:Putative membrane protein, BON domain n=1 Tax=Candidatus Ichthyocystis hellenicum TaxID=1561003 RepID=A0A0S4M964_9BURK|nr:MULTISPECIES: BON domain-containing protein [Ichthyocystis]CUT17988.1 putative membrane protein, BON domain [Candidatus Ichthyocystis hellenicum]
MKNNFFRLWACILSLVFAISLAPLMEGCGLAAVRGVHSATTADRRVASAVVLDRLIQLNSKSIANSILHSRGHVEVTVYNGLVLLTGQIPSHEDKIRVERALSRGKNVRRMVSGLIVAPETTIMQRADDSALTSVVKADICQLQKRFSSIISVVTENGVVYLIGIVTKEEAKMVYSRVRGIPGVKNVVEVFQIVSQDIADLLDRNYSENFSKNEDVPVD